MDKIEQKKSSLIDIFENFFLSADQKGLLSVRTLIFSFLPATGELTLKNEDASVRVTKQSSEWILPESTQDKEFRTRVVRKLQAALRSIKEEGYFDHPLFQLPLSIYFEDPDSKKSQELLLVEDAWADYQGLLMRGLNRDLSAFFDRLMSDSNLY